MLFIAFGATLPHTRFSTASSLAEFVPNPHTHTHTHLIILWKGLHALLANEQALSLFCTVLNTWLHTRFSIVQNNLNTHTHSRVLIAML